MNRREAKARQQRHYGKAMYYCADQMRRWAKRDVAFAESAIDKLHQTGEYTDFAVERLLRAIVERG